MRGTTVVDLANLPDVSGGEDEEAVQNPTLVKATDGKAPFGNILTYNHQFEITEKNVWSRTSGYLLLPRNP